MLLFPRGFILFARYGNGWTAFLSKCHRPLIIRTLVFVRTVIEKFSGIQFFSGGDHMWKYLTGADLSTEGERGYD